MKYFSLLIISLFAHSCFSQTVIAGHSIPSSNFYVLKDYINTHLKHTGIIKHNEQSSEGDHLYDRWIDYWKLRVNPDGSFPTPDQNYREMQRYKLSHPDYLRSGATSDWRQIPISYSSSPPGIGRVDRITVNPNNPAHLYISSPSGSLWESADYGTTWQVMTDQLPIIGLSGIIVDPIDTNTLYLASGDGEANMDNPSIGVLKSRDGGHTWSATGLSFTLTTGLNYISRIEMNPVNHLSMIVASSNGIYQTMDSGATWSLRTTGNFRDVKYMPGSGAICYATTSTDYYRSADSGSTWTVISYPGSVSQCTDRISIGVSPAAPGNVYLLAGGPAGSCTGGFVGLYASNDTGRTFYTKSTTPNILGYDPAGADNFSQSWYTLAFGVSPLDTLIMYAGGAYIWTTADGGLTWSSSQGYGLTHPDIHELKFTADGATLYSGTDGGVYHMTMGSGTWDYISNGLQNTQIYRIAVSEGDSTILMYGSQDNDVVIDVAGICDGSNLNADGFGCIIDPTNSSTLFGESEYGGINQSPDGGITWNLESLGSGGGWDAPYKMNPHNHLELFAGMDYFYHSVDGGMSWMQLGTTNATTIDQFAFSESNTQIIYATSFDNTQYAEVLYKTTDGGSNWIALSPPTLYGVSVSYIDVNNTNPNELWVTAGSYVAGSKVYHSIDGGSTWTNISGTLPNLPANCITYQKNSNGILYVGMDNGIYVISDSLSDWLPYYTNLPNAIVKEIKIRYTTNDLFAGTYGRGMWQAKPYVHTKIVSGVADIAAEKFSIYPNPVKDELTIETDISAGDAVIKIMDDAGRTVKQVNVNKEKISIPCADLSAGMYFISTEYNGSKAVQKFVKL